MADTDGFRNDWADQGLLQGPRCGPGRERGRHQEGLSQARPRQPPRLQPRQRREARQVQVGGRGLRRRGRCRQAHEVRRVPPVAVQWRLRPRHGRRLRRRGRRRLRHRRPAARPRRGRRWAGRHVRRPLRRRCPAPAHPGATAPRPGRRELGHDQLHRRHRRRDDLAAPHVGRGVRHLSGHRRQARDPAAHLPRVRGRRLRRRRHGRGVLDQRDLPRLRWSPARLRRRLPDVPRQRPGHLGEVDPGAHPRGCQGRREDPAQGQGRAGGERWSRRATSSSRSRSAPTPSSVAAATTSRSPCRSPSTRPRSARRSRSRRSAAPR